MDVDERGVHAAERLIHSVTADDTAVALDAVRASGDAPTGPGSPKPHRRTLLVAAVLLALVVAGGILLLARGDDTIETVDTGASVTSVTSITRPTAPASATPATLGETSVIATDSIPTSNLAADRGCLDQPGTLRAGARAWYPPAGGDPIGLNGEQGTSPTAERLGAVAEDALRTVVPGRLGGPAVFDYRLQGGGCVTHRYATFADGAGGDIVVSAWRLESAGDPFWVPNEQPFTPVGDDTLVSVGAHMVVVLAVAPDGTTVRVSAYGSGARDLVSGWPTTTTSTTLPGAEPPGSPSVAADDLIPVAHVILDAVMDRDAAPTDTAPTTPPSGPERLLQCATDDRAATIYEWADTASSTTPAESLDAALERFAPTGTVGVGSAVGTIRTDAIVDAGGSALVPIDVGGRIQAVLTLVRVDGGWHVNDEVWCEPIEQ